MDARWIRLFQQCLVRWYARNRRSLPWRETEDPFAIWVSEIMLQQTQVATVLPFYERFLQRFDGVEALALADEAEVLKYWEGLGYYRRARQMHAAARQIMAQYQGVFPRSFDDVLALPGIGRYTAGAICSFAFNSATPIVEANTQRLYARLLRLEAPLTEKESIILLWAFAEKILPKHGGRTINHAVMEFGALVCQPKPRCEVCPLIDLCPTFAENLQASIPAPKKRTLYEDRHEAALIVANSRRQYLIRQCGNDEWWAGLWDFPRFEVSTVKRSKSLVKEIVAKAKQYFNIDCQVEATLFSVKHSVTKYRITLTCFQATINTSTKSSKKKTAAKLSGQPSRWVSLEDLASIPLSASGRRIVDKLSANATQTT